MTLNMVIPLLTSRLDVEMPLMSNTAQYLPSDSGDWEAFQAWRSSKRQVDLEIMSSFRSCGCRLDTNRTPSGLPHWSSPATYNRSMPHMTSRPSCAVIVEQTGLWLAEPSEASSRLHLQGGLRNRFQAWSSPGHHVYARIAVTYMRHHKQLTIKFSTRARGICRAVVC